MAGDAGSREGWIKLHYKIEKNPIFQNLELLGLFVHMLVRARWCDGQLLDGTTLKRGQLIIGQTKLAKELRMSRQHVRTMISLLEGLGIIGCSAKKPTSGLTSGGTLVTICNYDTYQDTNGDSNQRINQRSTSAQPALNQRSTTEEERKKERREEGKKKDAGVPPYSRDFEAWWNAYPSKGRTDKRRAYKAYRVAVRSVDPVVLLAAAHAYARSPKVQEGIYVKHASTWLNGGCWEDDTAAWESTQAAPVKKQLTTQELFDMADAAAQRRQEGV